ncbi:MAG: universal stress protein [Saprospiraceae bacterium]|nr:universal stress protein [Saprospiraceae bacterium]
MKRIVIATDFSDACDNALKYATDLVKGTEIKIDLLNVYDIPIVVTSNMPTRAVDGIIYEKAKATESHLLELQQDIPVANRGYFKAIYGPYPATEIAEFSKKEGHDMIIMGMKQKYGLLDRMMGTVTAHTIQLSSVPVLAVPSQSTFVPYKHILFPTAHARGEDVGEAEEKAVKWLVEFGKLFGKPSIHMLHIKKGDDEDTVDVTYKSKIIEQLDFTISHAETIEAGIIKYYEREHAELLAFYKPYRYFWERIYHSSLVRKILFRTRVPLLIFR